MSAPTALLHPQRFDLIPDDPSLLPIRLVCGPQLVLGRNKAECDLVTWFLPRNEENDRETRKLSQIHTYLQHEGNFLRIRDADSATGTFWNRQSVPSGEGITTPIGPSGKLTLGRNYCVSLDWFSAAAPACALLRPAASLPAFHHCLWMTAANCAFQNPSGIPDGLWLMPCNEGAQANATLKARDGLLWWRACDHAEMAFQAGARLSIGDVPFTLHL